MDNNRFSPPAEASALDPQAGVADGGARASNFFGAVQVAQQSNATSPIAGAVVGVAAAGPVSGNGVVLLAADLAGATLKEFGGQLFVFMPDGSTVVVEGSAIASLLAQLRLSPALVAQSADGVVVLDVAANQAVDLTGSGFRHVRADIFDLPDFEAAGTIDQSSLEYRSVARAGEDRPDGQAALPGTDVNSPPVAVADGGSTDQDVAIIIDVLANDSDADGDPLTVTTASALNGAVTVNPDGTLGYTPDPNFNGTDTVTYMISDGNGGTDTATVTVTVNSVNDAPVASDVSASGNEDAASIAVTLTGSDIDGTISSVTLSNLPSNGTLYTDAGLTTLAATGTAYSGSSVTFHFVPAANYNGTATFDYTVTDDNGGSDATPATATITVDEAPDAVAARPSSLSANRSAAMCSPTMPSMPMAPARLGSPRSWPAPPPIPTATMTATSSRLAATARSPSIPRPAPTSNRRPARSWPIQQMSSITPSKTPMATRRTPRSRSASRSMRPSISPASS